MEPISNEIFTYNKMDEKMDQDAKKSSEKREYQLHVPVSEAEKKDIKRQAQQAGLSIARYLRDVGQRYQIKSIVDYEQVKTLVRINGDLGRLGGLLKLWLSDDQRTAYFDKAILQTLLREIKTTQDQMRGVMNTLIHLKG